MTYRNLQTNEIAPAHNIGTNDEGKTLYQFVEGWEPTFPYTTDEDGNWIEATLIEALDAEAERIEIAPTDGSDGVTFSPVLNHPELVAWADQEVTAYNAAELLKVLRTFQPNPEHDERENYEAVCVEIQEIETFETGSNLYDSEREAYVLYAEQE